jgi:RNA polymerase sigma factor (sigma-70 family)
MLYRYPVFAYIRRLRYPADVTEDLTQSFFAEMLEKNHLGALEQGRGRFRNWLLVAVKHFLANRRDHEQAEKRGGDQVRVDLEDAEVASREISDPTPEEAFERHWALRILEDAMNALGEECARAGKGLLFGKLKQALVGDAEDSSASVAKELGMEVGTVRINVFRLRRRYQAMVEQAVLHTVKDPDDVPDELRFLKSVLKRNR